MPDRVSDAPIPNLLWPKWCEEGDHPYFAISNGPTEYKCIICHLTEENDRLEAEKQDARRIGLEFALHLATETADWCIEEQEKGYLGAMRVADAIKRELAKTVKPQGDAHTEGWNAALKAVGREASKLCGWDLSSINRALSKPTAAKQGDLS